jgi:predicted enzyme related to lactoylglutathione lyase
VSRRVGVVLDCRDPSRLAPFWAEALEYTIVGGEGSYVLLVPADGPGPQLLLQAVPETKGTKNRMHMDIHTSDIDHEAARLIELGAERVAPQPLEEHGSRWILMRDPEGNEFCICDAAGAC